MNIKFKTNVFLKVQCCGRGVIILKLRDRVKMVDCNIIKNAQRCKNGSTTHTPYYDLILFELGKVYSENISTSNIMVFYMMYKNKLNRF